MYKPSYHSVSREWSRFWQLRNAPNTHTPNFHYSVISQFHKFQMRRTGTVTIQIGDPPKTTWANCLTNPSQGSWGGSTQEFSQKSTSGKLATSQISAIRHDNVGHTRITSHQNPTVWTNLRFGARFRSCSRVQVIEFQAWSVSFGRQIFEFWCWNFGFWPNISKSCLFEVNAGGGVWGPPRGFVIGVGKKNPHTPWQPLLILFTKWLILVFQDKFYKSNFQITQVILQTGGSLQWFPPKEKVNRVNAFLYRFWNRKSLRWRPESLQWRPKSNVLRKPLRVVLKTYFTGPHQEISRYQGRIPSFAVSVECRFFSDFCFNAFAVVWCGFHGLVQKVRFTGNAEFELVFLSHPVFSGTKTKLQTFHPKVD